MGPDYLCSVTPERTPRSPDRRLDDREKNLSARRTVLVVDDQHVVLELVDAFLEGTGYSVYLAGDGRQALDICNRLQGAVDLLLADVRMPRMSGPELYSQVIERYPKVKVLFMSGYQSTEAVHLGLPDGAPLIGKPFRPDSLVERLHQVMAQEPTEAK